LEELTPGAGLAYALAFAPGGRTLVIGTRDGTVELWNVPSRREIGELQVHDSIVCALAFAPDGRTLATTGIDGTLRLWDAPAFADTDSSAEKS
jgi:WD40 repeat protein